jgi:hypothetical protein
MHRVPDIDPIRVWCEQELVLMRRQMKLLQSGKTGTYECDDDGSQIDTTSQTAKQLEMKITALESLLTRTKSSEVMS